MEAISADAIALYLQELEQRGLAASTIRKDRAALNGFAKYLHALRAIDVTEILMIQGPRMHRAPSTRDSLDTETWQRVQQTARARAEAGSALAARDEAIIVCSGRRRRADELRGAQEDRRARPARRGGGGGALPPARLRHTFATLYMQRDGARLEQLQVLMGHASIDTTAQYLHTTADELEADAMRREVAHA